MRRVPTRVRNLDGGNSVRVTLQTKSLEITRDRRDVQEAVDSRRKAKLLAYWSPSNEAEPAQFFKSLETMVGGNGFEPLTLSV